MGGLSARAVIEGLPLERRQHFVFQSFDSVQKDAGAAEPSRHFRDATLTLPTKTISILSMLRTNTNTE